MGVHVDILKCCACPPGAFADSEQIFLLQVEEKDQAKILDYYIFLLQSAQQIHLLLNRAKSMLKITSQKCVGGKRLLEVCNSLLLHKV